MAAYSIKQIETHWDSFSDHYVTYDQGSNVLYLSLLNMLRVEKRDAILEIGAGGGFLYHHTLNFKKQTAKYVATDLSENMLKILCKRLNVEYHPSQVNTFEQYNLTVLKANAEELQFADSSFDCLIANLCLHITTDPVKMLKEASRVLQKGGVAGFSVWGDDKGLHYYNIIPSVLKELGQYTQDGRSYFHLNDREKLIKMMEDAGFTNVVCWNQYTPFHYQTEQEMREVLGTYYNQEVTNKVIEKFNHQIQQNKLPFGLDALMVIGTKK